MITTDKIKNSKLFDLTKRIPSLAQKCLETLTTQDPNIITKLSQDYAIECFAMQQKIHTLKQEMIASLFYLLKIAYAGSYVYGSYVRDKIGKMPFNNIINIHFPDLDTTTEFVAKISNWYRIFILDQTNNINTINILVQHATYIEIVIELHLNYNYKHHQLDELDFDVNMLKLPKPSIDITSLSLINKTCNIPEIYDHIREKSFIVLDLNGLPILKHINCFAKPIFNINGSLEKILIDMDNYNRNRNCISRNSPRGRELLEKISRMKNLGWACLNQPCTDPTCVLYHENP